MAEPVCAPKPANCLQSKTEAPQSKPLARQRNPNCIPQSFVLKFAVMNKPNLDELRKFIATPESPHLGPQPRSGTESLAAMDPASEEFVSKAVECQEVAFGELALTVNTIFILDNGGYNKNRVGDLPLQSDPLGQMQPDVTKLFMTK